MRASQNGPYATVEGPHAIRAGSVQVRPRQGRYGSRRWEVLDRLSGEVLKEL